MRIEFCHLSLNAFLTQNPIGSQWLKMIMYFVKCVFRISF